MSSSMPGGAQGSQTLGGFGDIINGVGSFVQGDEEKKMGNYNATVYEQQAQAERNNQVLLQAQKQKAINAQLGTQTAMVAKSGIKMTGSPLEVKLDSLTNANLDLAIDKYNSDVMANKYQNQAAMTKYEAKNAQIGSDIKGGVSLLSGALKIGAAFA